MITEAGGVTVLAHPFAVSPRARSSTADVVTDAGRGRASPASRSTTRTTTPTLAPTCGRWPTTLGLIVTGSSDYHGTNKTVRLGAETTAPEMLDALAERATGGKILVG